MTFLEVFLLFAMGITFVLLFFVVIGLKEIRDSITDICKKDGVLNSMVDGIEKLDKRLSALEEQHEDPLK